MDEGIPIEPDAGFDQKAIGETPAIFSVGGDFGVELLVQRGER